MLVSGFLELVSVEAARHVHIGGGDGVLRVHAERGEVLNILLLADLREVIAVNRADTEHHLVIDGKLLIFSLITALVGITILVEVHNRNTFFTVAGNLLGEVHGVEHLN